MIQKIKKRNFSAPLPIDFIILKKITRYNGVQLCNEPFISMCKINWNNKFKREQFYIGEDKIYFSGSFSRCLLIKLFQKVWEFIFPKKYILDYVNETEYLAKKKESDDKIRTAYNIYKQLK